MENTFFDEELIESEYSILCPNCKTKFRIGLEHTEITCECGEEFLAEPFIGFPEDFVWHPSERY